MRRPPEAQSGATTYATFPASSAYESPSPLLMNMKPVPPLKPLSGLSEPASWRKEFGEAASSGDTGHLRYAYSPKGRRLLSELGGQRTLYDTGTHQFSGVLQGLSVERALSFKSPHGTRALDSLKAIPL